MEDHVEDIIVDVVVNGRILKPKEIPLQVSEEIDAILEQGGIPKAVYYNGVYYLWFVRPCVYP